MSNETKENKNNVVQLKVKKLKETKITPEELYENAKGVFEDVALIGWDKDDTLAIWTSKDMTEAELNWVVDKVKLYLMGVY